MLHFEVMLANLRDDGADCIRHINNSKDDMNGNGVGLALLHFTSNSY